MNTPAVVLCIDQVSQRYPEQLGLSGENFSTQPWLKVFNEGLSVRNYLGVQDASKRFGLSLQTMLRL